MISESSQQGPHSVAHQHSTPRLELLNAQLHLRSTGASLLTIPQLSIHRGERLVVTGPSGSGKSLLLSMITGRWSADLDFTGHRRKNFSRIGFVPQRGQDALHPLLRLGRQLSGATGRNLQDVKGVLNLVGLDDPGLLRRRPAELSGGQAQRAAIALAVLCRATLIIADEPTSALDHASREMTLELFERILTPQHTLVMATHDAYVAQRVATTRLFLDSGRIQEDVNPQLLAVPA